MHEIVRRGRVALAAVLAFLTTSVAAFDCNRNGIDDVLDIASGRSVDCNANSVPDECDIAPVNLEFSPVDIGDLSCSGTDQVAVADLDRDGHADLAGVCRRGLIQFAWGTSRGFDIDWVATEISPRAVAVADFDNDGSVEVVAGGEGIALFRLSGVRTWTERRVSQVVVAAVEAGDFDGDGDSDIAVVDNQSLLRVFYNQGEESFEAKTIVVGARPVDVAAADFNGDGLLDLATGNSQESVSILLSEGAAGFAPPRSYFSGSVQRILAHDFDADGRPDLAAALQREIAVLRNSGEGEFFDRLTMPTSPGTTMMLAGDADEDGDVDLLVGGSRRAPLTSYWNRGDGSFASPVDHPRIAGVTGLAAISNPGDVAPRWVAIDLAGDILHLIPGSRALSPDCNESLVPDECELDGNDCNENGVPDECDLATGASRDCDFNAVPDECDTDCDENGIPDACEIADGSASDCNGNGALDACDEAATPRFGEADRFQEGGEFIFAEAGAFDDLDGDGRDDFIVVVSDAQRRIRTARSDGERLVFDAEFSPAWTRSDPLRIADFDGDGDLDVVVMSLREEAVIEVAVNDRGVFESIVSLEGSETGRFVASGDLDGDGDLDFLRFDEQRRLRVDMNDGDKLVPGPFSRRNPFAEVELVDLDGDGTLDLLVTTEDRETRWLAGNGAGDFELIAGSIEFGARSDRFVVGDFRPGGGDEVVVIRSDGIGTLVGLEDGVLKEISSAPVPSFGPVAAMDYDDDGDDDLVVAEFDWQNSTAVVRFFSSSGDGRFVPRRGPEFGEFEEPAGIAAGDIDGDGQLDLVVGAQMICLACDFDIGWLGFGSTLFQFSNSTEMTGEVDHNRNGILDSCEDGTFHRGDADADGRLAITDAIRVLGWLFSSGEIPSCRETADFDNDGRVALDDPVGLLYFLFSNGRPPAAPGAPDRPCGADPDPKDSPGHLGCESYSAC